MLNIHSIFETISGEAGGFPQGTWITGVRLQGCNLACKWCDTDYSRADYSENATIMSVSQIVKQCHTKHILITGGEPLMQSEEVVNLINEFIQQRRIVQVETNGSIPLPLILTAGFFPSPLHWVVDYKCPSSRMNEKMPSLSEFVKMLQIASSWGNKVYVKWVVADEKDLLFALNSIDAIIDLHGLHYLPIPQIISPLDGDGTKIVKMVEYIKREKKKHLLGMITFSIQLHKIFNLP